jgi:hypothetical protein
MGAERELYIRARSLPTGLRFKHSFFRGEVSLILERKWAEPTREWLTAHRPGGSSLVQYGGELYLRIPTEVMDPAVPLPQQDQTAVQALDTITRLMPLAEQIAQQGA